jgi:hypothetical protein
MSAVRLASAQPAGNEQGNASKRQNDGTDSAAHQDEDAERDERDESYLR